MYDMGTKNDEVDRNELASADRQRAGKGVDTFGLYCSSVLPTIASCTPSKSAATPALPPSRAAVHWRAIDSSCDQGHGLVKA